MTKKDEAKSKGSQTVGSARLRAAEQVNAKEEFFGAS